MKQRDKRNSKTVEFHPETCRNCGNEHAPELPATRYLIKSGNGKFHIRCPQCRTPNTYEKRSQA